MSSLRMSEPRPRTRPRTPVASSPPARSPAWRAPDVTPRDSPSPAARPADSPPRRADTSHWRAADCTPAVDRDADCPSEPSCCDAPRIDDSTLRPVADAVRPICCSAGVASSLTRTPTSSEKSDPAAMRRTPIQFVTAPSSGAVSDAHRSAALAAATRCRRGTHPCGARASCTHGTWTEGPRRSGVRSCGPSTRAPADRSPCIGRPRIAATRARAHGQTRPTP